MSTVNSNPERIRLLSIFSSRPIQSYEEDKNYFVSFREEAEKILLAIETYENAIIIGDRGSGKTSLLNHMMYKLMDDPKLICVELSALSLSQFDQITLLRRIIKELREKSEKFRSKSEKILEGIFSTMDSVQERKERQRRFEEEDDPHVLLKILNVIMNNLRKSQIKICFLLDDTDKIDSKLVWQTFRNIRDEIWKLKISIILTVLPSQVSEITRPPLDHFFHYWIKISPFNFSSVKELIEQRTQSISSKIRIDDDALKEILKRADGNPRNVLEILKKIFETESTNKITRKEIDNLGLVFANAMPDIEKAICNYLIRHPYTSASSGDFATQIGVSRSRLAQILNKLKREGLIGSKQDGRMTTYYITESGLEVRDQKDEEKITEGPIVQIVNFGAEPPEFPNSQKTKYHPNLRNDGHESVSNIRIYYKIMDRIVDLNDIIREQEEIKKRAILYEGSILPGDSARVNAIDLDRTDKEISVVLWLEYDYGVNQTNEIIFNIHFRNFEKTDVKTYVHSLIVKIQKEQERMRSGIGGAPIFEKFKCKNCGYPAANSTIFKELESPYRETLECPKCGSMEIIDYQE